MTTRTDAPPKLPLAWFKHLFWRAHRAVNRLSGGRFLWTPEAKRGWGAMRLTTTGRRTGRLRTVIVGYLLDDDGTPFAMAMNGWDEGHPAWWLNLRADPVATVRTDRHAPRRVHAHEATGDERDRLWRRWLETDPALMSHATGRTTPTPIVVLAPLPS